MVTKASEYRWSGWGTAPEGNKQEIAGLCDVTETKPAQWEVEGCRVYGRWLVWRWGEKRLSKPSSRAIDHSLDLAERRVVVGWMETHERWSRDCGRCGISDQDESLNLDGFEARWITQCVPTELRLGTRMVFVTCLRKLHFYQCPR